MKQKLPLVSIIIPVYNGSNYVSQAIDSALAQTYKKIEVVVVNDGSTDNTEEIVKGYGKKVRYYKKKNGGVATALNMAIKKAKGEYISWLSHDDLYYPEKIEKQVSALSEQCLLNEGETIVYSNYSLIYENSTKVTHLNFDKTHDVSKLKYPLYPLLNGLINGCTLLIPKTCFKIGFFNPLLRATQDYDLWFRMFPHYHLLFMSDQLVKTRLHSEQGTKTIPSVTSEGNDLWIKMIDGLSNKQKIMIGGSVMQFYKKVRQVLIGAGLLGASKHVELLIAARTTRDVNNIKVSVIIPFYNRINKTKLAIKSVLNQTHKNTEIIVINDGSTEDVGLLQKFCLEKKVKFIRNRKNMGASCARNLGIKAASGEYIAFLDSDDVFLRDKIRKQLTYMVSNGYDFSHTSYITHDEISGNDRRVMSGKIDFTFPSIISYCGIATPTVMINREYLLAHNRKFPENMGVGEDVCLWISLAANEPLYGLIDPLTYVNTDLSSASANMNKQIIGTKNIIGYVIDNNLSQLSALDIEILSNSLVLTIRKQYLPNSFLHIISNILRKSIFKSKLTVIKYGLKLKGYLNLKMANP